MTNPVLTIVVPCYNEEEVLPETELRLSRVLSELIHDQLISAASTVLFVDDGSRDRTWTLIEQFHHSNPYVTGLKLANNAGHQSALLAGLMTAAPYSDCVISIDADLQDDVGVMREFIVKFRQGCDVVYGVRKSRATDTWAKRFTAQGFYRLMTKMGVNLRYNHADYRLLSKRALQALERYKEVNLFLRGIVPLIGFPSAEVYYDRLERFAGESKYPLRKMLAFALEGITSFSVKPIRFVTLTGFGFSVLSLLALLYAVIGKIWGTTVSGWTSIMLSIWFIGGVQLLALGLIGEYIGKIYKEVKHRPLYVIEKQMLTDAARNEYRQSAAEAATSVGG